MSSENQRDSRWQPATVSISAFGELVNLSKGGTGLRNFGRATPNGFMQFLFHPRPLPACLAGTKGWEATGELNFIPSLGFRLWVRRLRRRTQSRKPREAKWNIGGMSVAVNLLHLLGKPAGVVVVECNFLSNAERSRGKQRASILLLHHENCAGQSHPTSIK